MFREHVGLPPMSEQDTIEYLTEREGIRMYSGNQDEEAAVQGAKEDLIRLQARE